MNDYEVLTRTLEGEVINLSAAPAPTEAQETTETEELSNIELAGQVTLVGMFAVFGVLAILWAVLSLFNVIFGKKNAKKPTETPTPAKAPAPAPAPVKQTAPAPVPVAAVSDDAQLVAVITAAVAAYRAAENPASDVNGFRVVSFRRTNGGKPWNAR